MPSLKILALLIVCIISTTTFAQPNPMCRSAKYPADSCAVMCIQWREVGYNSLAHCVTDTECRFSCGGARDCPPCGED